MKIEIWNEKQDKPEEPLRLRLVDEGGIYLVAVDKSGEPLSHGYILHITDEGYLQVVGDCNVPGLKTDSRGRVEVKR